MLRDVINLVLLPLHLAIRPNIGLVLKGSVDDVRWAARRAKIIPVRGVEIIGLTRPSNSSCAFLADMQSLRFIRVFAAALTDIERIEALKELRYLRIEFTEPGQSIPIDFRHLQNLENIVIHWFGGAESLFYLERLKSLSIKDYPNSSSDSLKKLRTLTRLRLATCALSEIDALREVPALRWLALLGLNKLKSFTGISHNPSIRFLWIERCPKLRTMEWFAGMKALETLRILNCGEIAGMEVIQSLPHLRHIHIHGSVKADVRNTSFLRDLPNLESVIIKGLPSEEMEYWKRRNKEYKGLRPDL